MRNYLRKGDLLDQGSGILTDQTAPAGGSELLDQYGEPGITSLAGDRGGYAVGSELPMPPEYQDWVDDVALLVVILGGSL